MLAVLGRKPLDARSRRSALALHTSSPGETLATALGGVESRWGDTAGYLRHHGLPERVLRALDSRTLGPADRRGSRCGVELKLLHLSDIHATAGGDLYGEVDASPGSALCAHS